MDIVKFRCEVIWDVMLFRWVSFSRRFEGTLCFQLQGRDSSTLQGESATFLRNVGKH